jgi:hypothetical protein
MPSAKLISAGSVLETPVGLGQWPVGYSQVGCRFRVLCKDLGSGTGRIKQVPLAGVFDLINPAPI